MEILGDPSRHDSLKGYVQGVLHRFKSDRRIHAWDIFNEPDNDNRNAYPDQETPRKAELSFALLKKAYGWAREANPSQPITAGVWLGDWSAPEKMLPINRFMIEESDIITYHPAKHAEGLRDGTLKQLFREEIKKSFEEYIAQVGQQLAESTTYFQEALNEVLAGGKKIF